jgi:hypothetical protein
MLPLLVPNEPENLQENSSLPSQNLLPKKLQGTDK